MGRYSLKNLSGGLAAKMPSKTQLKQMGMVAAGGALGGVAYNLALEKVTWFQKSQSTTGATLRKAGLAAGLAVVGGSLLWDVQNDVAVGLIGAMGATIGTAVAARAGVLSGLGTRIYDNMPAYAAPLSGRYPAQLAGEVSVRENEYVFGGSPMSATLAAF